MDSEIWLLVIALVLGCSAMGSVWIFTSSRVRIEEARVEKAAIYAGRNRDELMANSLASVPTQDQDMISQLIQLAAQNPQLVQQFLGGLQGNQKPPIGGVT